MILLHGESCNFCTTLPKMAAGGKAYASRSSHGRLSASTAVARGSGTGDTNRGNLLLNLMANRSICSQCHLHIVRKTSGRRDHSVWMVWPSLDSLSATTFTRAGICWALRVTCFLVHQVKILHNLLLFVYPWCTNTTSIDFRKSCNKRNQNKWKRN